MEQRTGLLLLNFFCGYGRIVLCSILGLLTGRWILVALQSKNFGIFCVVAGCVNIVLLCIGCFTTGVNRFLAYAEGVGNLNESRQWFQAAVKVHLGFSLALLLVGSFAGYFVVFYFLNIPDEQRDIAYIAYLVLLVNNLITLATLPYNGIFFAKQRIFEISFLAILCALANAGWAFFLTYWNHDQLLGYISGLFGITVLSNVLLICRAVYLFDECRGNFIWDWDWSKEKKLINFFSWSIIGTVGGVGKSCGMVLLTNVVFGEKINAALGIANQLGGQTDQISTCFSNMIAPEITVLTAQKKISAAVALADRSSKFSLLLSLLIITPLLTELDMFLTLWLGKNVPELSAEFCWIILAMFVAEKLTLGYMVLISANGKIALYQVVSGIILVSALPLACILKAFGCNAVCVVSCSLMVTVVCALSRIVWCRKFFGIPCFCWFREVLLPVTLVTSLTLIPAMSLHFLLSTGPLRLFLVFSLVPATMLALSWLLGLTREEKEFIFRLLKNSICRLRCNFAS